MGVAGWLYVDTNIWFKIGMCLVTTVIEVWGFHAAVQWARALVRDKIGLPFCYWTLIVFACSGWTIFSLYHALGLISEGMGAAATPAYIAFTALALSLPFHEWAIERVESAPRKPAPIVETVMPPVEAPPQKAPQVAARLVAKELSRQSPRSASKRRGDASEHRVASRAPPLSEQELRQAVSELTQQGEVISIRRVAKHLDIPPSRVERSPGKHLLRAVA